MQERKFWALVASAVAALVMLVVMIGLVGNNDDQEWQIKQDVTGNVTVVDRPGWYWKGFATVWTYPRAHEAYYSKSEEEGGLKDLSIKVIFNDGGRADTSTYVRIELPKTAEERRKIHQAFGGNLENLMGAVRSHLNNCLKATGPLMSASEHQTARKAEFSQLVDEQLRLGLYKMRRIEKTLDDGLLETVGEGQVIEKPQKVTATEIVLDEETGEPVIAQKSPLQVYGIDVVQFSVTDTSYDPKTEEQFAAKKESYLKAEEAKASRQNEIQQTLMVVEKGKREVAEIEAQANQAKKKAEVEAEQAAQVAEIAKRQAVTEATQKVEVAEQEKAEAETRKEIAAIEAETADLKGQAIIKLAEAKEQEILLGGAGTEKDQILAQIAAERDAKVAEYLSKVNVPGVVIVGGENGGEDSGASSLQEVLMNLLLLKSTGVLDPNAETTKSTTSGSANGSGQQVSQVRTGNGPRHGHR